MFIHVLLLKSLSPVFPHHLMLKSFKKDFTTKDTDSYFTFTWIGFTENICMSARKNKYIHT